MHHKHVKYHTRQRIDGFFSHSSTHLIHCLRWCSTPFLLVLVTFASFAVVILVQKVKTPRYPNIFIPPPFILCEKVKSSSVCVKVFFV